MKREDVKSNDIADQACLKARRNGERQLKMWTQSQRSNDAVVVTNTEPGKMHVKLFGTKIYRRPHLKTQRSNETNGHKHDQA